MVVDQTILIYGMRLTWIIEYITRAAPYSNWLEQNQGNIVGYARFLSLIVARSLHDQE
jgi:hypothetical protein